MYKAESTICASHLKLQTSYSIFANKKKFKNEYICSFSGTLIDCTTRQNCDLLTYIFISRGFKLMGADLDSDLGHLVNSIHADSPLVVQNAKFCKNSLK